MMAFPAPEKDAGEVSASPALSSPHVAQTSTDSLSRNGGASTADPKAAFNHGRHRWLGQVVRDAKLPGAATRVAVLLWELMNFERQCAWPSLVYIAEQLRMNKSTVARSIKALVRREWIQKRKRGGRHRSNEYRISWSMMDDKDENADFETSTRAHA